MTLERPLEELPTLEELYARPWCVSRAHTHTARTAADHMAHTHCPHCRWPHGSHTLPALPLAGAPAARTTTALRLCTLLTVLCTCTCACSRRVATIDGVAQYISAQRVRAGPVLRLRKSDLSIVIAKPPPGETAAAGPAIRVVKANQVNL